MIGLRVFLCAVVISSCSGPAPAPPQPSNPYLGLSKEEAIRKAEAIGQRYRIIAEDGRRYPVTKDYRPQRANFTLERGRVVRVNLG